MRTILVCATDYDVWMNRLRELQLEAGESMKGHGNHVAIGLIEYRRISDPERLRGHHNAIVEFWGPWADRSDASDWFELANFARLP